MIKLSPISQMFLKLAIALPLMLLTGQGFSIPPETQSITGEWRFALDRLDLGEQERWFARDLTDTIPLPGTLQQHGFGDLPTSATDWTGNVGVRTVDWIADPKFAPYTPTANFKMPFILTPKLHYIGAAWYQRDVTIPSTWQGKQISLLLERPHWQTTLWVGEKQVGSHTSLGTPHEYDLTELLTPGQHRVTFRVDNRLHVPVGVDAHSVSDQTQTNWNGVIGELSLTARDGVWIQDAQVFPNVAERNARVVLQLGNCTGTSGSGTVHVRAEGYNTQDIRHAETTTSITWDSTGGSAEVTLHLGSGAPLWDEFSPALYRLALQFQGNGFSDKLEDSFALRELKSSGTQFVLNDRKIFLRGTLECCIFPLTGYPPTDPESWKRILRIARSHGLNHLRFHSWCPPEAAFQAADEIGFYFQVETSSWSTVFGDGTPLDAWSYEEAERMLLAYGNHPSFMFMGLSNEPGREKDVQTFMSEWVSRWKKHDPRRLYVGGAAYPTIPEEDFHVAPGTRGVPEKSKQGETTFDHRQFIQNHAKPVVFHEIGQYSAYPNFAEIAKYAGDLKPGNLEILQDFLTSAGMLQQSQDFLMASGKLQALCYKEEIESTLRTPGMGGFQLLDLHDFPGQGTSLIGVLDAFWDSKGYISPEAYSRFCGDTVPLARLSKRCFTNSEILHADIEVSHFGPSDLTSCTSSWLIRDDTGLTVAEGANTTTAIPTGALASLGKIQLPLHRFKKAVQLNLEVKLEDTSTSTAAENDWDFWVYPAIVETPVFEDIHIARTLDQDAVETLDSGGKVLLLPSVEHLAGDTTGSFTPVFWSRATFPSQKNHTLGILSDPAHPVFRHFPTDFHSNWQWQDLVQQSKPMVLNGMPRDLHPLVQVIDDPFLCRKLGLVFEARVGQGKLLLSAIDLDKNLQNRPVARQLRHSLLLYMSGKDFNPKTPLTLDQLRTLFDTPAGFNT